MTKLLAVVCVGLVVADALMLVCMILMSRKISSLDAEVDKRDIRIRSLDEDVDVLRKALEMSERLRNGAEKKIDELHSGDVVHNAVDVLSKRVPAPGT